MELQPILIDKKLSLYVKEVFTLGNQEADKQTRLPFYADGYPGIIFQQSLHGVFLKPKDKWLSEFFLYGQTIDPIELSITGPFQLIVFQLYPFAARTLIGIDPIRLNDDCFDLALLANVNVDETIRQLKTTSDFDVQKEMISRFLLDLVQHVTIHPDQRVQIGIKLILSSKGTISLKDLQENLHITERTLERQFVKEIGVSAKQFIKIISVQHLTQTTLGQGLCKAL